MKRNEQIDGTEFACLTINADLEAENEKLKKQLALTEKALKLLTDKKRYYLFVNENTETINVDFAMKLAEKEAKDEQSRQ